MSAARDALLDAEVNAIFEHGESFWVDGKTAEYTGVVDGMMYGNVLTETGLEMKRTARLTFLQSEWIPEVGKQIKLRSRYWIVAEIGEDTESSYTVRLIEAHK